MLQMYVYLANWGDVKCQMVRIMGLVDAKAVGLVPIPPWDHMSRTQPGDTGHWAWSPAAPGFSRQPTWVSNQGVYGVVLSSMV